MKVGVQVVFEVVKCRFTCVIAMVFCGEWGLGLVKVLEKSKSAKVRVRRLILRFVGLCWST